MAVSIALDHRENFPTLSSARARGIHVAADCAQVVRQRAQTYFGPDRASIKFHGFCHGNRHFQSNRYGHLKKIAYRTVQHALVTTLAASPNRSAATNSVESKEIPNHRRRTWSLGCRYKLLKVIDLGSAGEATTTIRVGTVFQETADERIHAWAAWHTCQLFPINALPRGVRL